MDLSKIVDHEMLFDLVLLDPINEQPIPGVGEENKDKFVTFRIRSDNSQAVTDVSDKGTNKMLRRKKLSVDTLKSEYLANAAAMIAEWDWCGNEWNGEADPECTDKVKLSVVRENWIYKQVVEAAAELENFT